MADDYKKVRSGEYKMEKRERDILEDGKQAPHVFSIPTDSEKEDLDRLRYESVGNKGYPREAFRYDY